MKRFSSFSALGSRRFNRRRARRRGAVFIEFAFVAPILIALVLGVVQYGLLAQTTEAVTNLSREGARFGTLGASGQTDDKIVARVKDAAADAGLNKAEITISIDPPMGDARRVQGGAMTVAVTYNLKNKVFLPGTSYILDKYRQPPSNDPMYTATAVMRILNP